MILPLLAIVFLQSTGTGQTPGRKGVDLYQSCLAGIRVIDDPQSSASDAVAGNECMDYIRGFADGLSTAEDKLACIEGATVGTLMRVYVKYISQHPKLMDQPQTVGLYLSLATEYFCTPKLKK